MTQSSIWVWNVCGGAYCIYRAWFLCNVCTAYLLASSLVPWSSNLLWCFYFGL